MQLSSDQSEHDYYKSSAFLRALMFISIFCIIKSEEKLCYLEFEL